MVDVTVLMLAKQLAEILSKPPCVNNDKLFELINERLGRKNLFIECNQRGIQGTHVRISSVEKS